MKKSIMPLPALLTFILAASVLHGKDSQTEEFHVSEVGSDKTELLRVFGQVKAQEAGESPVYKVLQRLNAKEYLVHPMSWRRNSSGVSSSAGIGGGGGVSSSMVLRPDYSKTYWLVLDSPADFVSDDRISDISTELSGELRSYTDVQGVERTVRELVVEAGKNLTKDQFVARLRSGEKWRLKKYKDASCRKCLGSGERSRLAGGGKCSDCKGSGRIPVDLIVQW